MTTDSPTQPESKLEPCPFCQQPVKAVGIVGGTDNQWLVGCDNLSCPASDISCSPERWNSRVVAPQDDDLLYRFARHVRNTDEIHPATWGVQGINLLAELRELDPDRYDREVKAIPSPASSPVPPEQSYHDGFDDAARVSRVLSHVAATPTPVEQEQVQCADCLAWINRDANHSCRQQVRHNQRRAR